MLALCVRSGVHNVFSYVKDNLRTPNTSFFVNDRLLDEWNCKTVGSFLQYSS